MISDVETRVRTIILASFGIACWLSMAAVSAEEMPAPDQQTIWTFFSNSDPLEAAVSYGAVSEAAVFIYSLCGADALPMTPSNDCGSLTVNLSPPSFHVRYPLTVKAEVVLKDADKSRQWYFLTKEAQDGDWQVTAGWSVTTGGEKFKPLELPSEEEQGQANIDLPDAMKACGADKKKSWIKEYLSILFNK